VVTSFLDQDLKVDADDTRQERRFVRRAVIEVGDNLVGSLHQRIGHIKA
jgi:hypothetical protein